MNPEIVPLGDRAVLVNFQQTIHPEIHTQVMNLNSRTKDASIAGITFIQPAYCSLTLGYDPRKISFQELKALIRDLLSQPTKQPEAPARRLDLPVCYQGEFAPDLNEIANRSELEAEEIIRLHTGMRYQVFMLGFLPGFPYMGILPEELQVSRKNTPRMKVAERSVGIAGLQTGVYPVESPGGWNIIARTPVPLFEVSTEHPFLFQPGDQVKFMAVSPAEYQEIREAVRNQSFDRSSLYDKDP